MIFEKTVYATKNIFYTVFEQKKMHFSLMGKCPLKTVKNTQLDANDKWTASTELCYQQVK